MQWLLQDSSEAPDVAGLGAIAGSCERFTGKLKVPHVGWNRITKVGNSRLLNGVESGDFVYYSHSYRAPVVAETVAVTEYEGPYSAVLESGNLFGIQFHPEKSGATGLQLLRNFVTL